MQRLAIILLLTGSALPALGAKPVTVQQLEQLSFAVHGKGDAEVATQLSELELTERLSAVEQARLEEALTGPKSRRAMIALADASAFLDPPAADVPKTAAPDMETQGRIISFVADYAIKAIHGMPNFYAARTTTRFDGTSIPANENEPVTGGGESFHFADKSSVTVVYRDGQEEIDAGTDKKAKSTQSSCYGLNSWGLFGPLLGAVINDAFQGTVTWSHWERGATGLLAVFHYVVPQAKSHYDVKYCCVSLDRGMSSFSGTPGYFEATPGYHGEIAVDPASGAILRLVVQTELQPTLPIVRDDVVVDYGPVDIGGVTYICPIKSVAISKAEVAEGGLPYNSKGVIPRVTALNDVVFTEYHVFRANARIVIGDSRHLSP